MLKKKIEKCEYTYDKKTIILFLFPSIFKKLSQ